MDFGSLTPNLSVAITNLGDAFGNIRTLILYSAYIIGLLLFIKGFMDFRNATQAAGGRHEFGGSLMYFVSGIALIYFPSTLDSGLTTVFGNTSTTINAQTISYLSKGSSSSWPDLLKILLKYVQIIGYIAFIRGWMLIARSGQGQQQSGGHGSSKGITHIIAGILLVNISGTIDILAQTFGLTT
jgi:intracellular multiplication protein IcmC